MVVAWFQSSKLIKQPQRIQTWYIYLTFLYHKNQPTLGKYTINGTQKNCSSKEQKLTKRKIKRNPSEKLVVELAKTQKFGKNMSSSKLDDLAQVPWEPTVPSFLGIISPIYWGFKTFGFPWVLGSEGRRCLKPSPLLFTLLFYTPSLKLTANLEDHPRTCKWLG